MNDQDVTEYVNWDNIDGEHLSLAKCVCGRDFPYWGFSLGVYRATARKCPNCGRYLYFRNEIKVFERRNDNELEKD